MSTTMQLAKNEQKSDSFIWDICLIMVAFASRPQLLEIRNSAKLNAAYLSWRQVSQAVFTNLETCILQKFSMPVTFY